MITWSWLNAIFVILVAIFCAVMGWRQAAGMFIGVAIFGYLCHCVVLVLELFAKR